MRLENKDAKGGEEVSQNFPARSKLFNSVVGVGLCQWELLPLKSQKTPQK